MSNDLIKQESPKEDLNYFLALAQIAVKSGNYPISLDCMVNIMLTAKDLGISPMKALNGGFYIVNGKISMSTALMADRIRKEGHSIKIPEWDSKKCVIIGVRKDNGDSIKFEYTMEDAVNANLVNSPTWKRFPKQMLYNRAMSTLARTLFPDVVGNAYSEDEKFDVLNISPEKRPSEDPDMITVEPTINAAPDPFCDLQHKLEIDNISTERLDDFLLMNAEKYQKSKEAVIIAAISNDASLNRFKKAYIKWVFPKEEISA